MSTKIIVADAGPLIALAKLDQLELMRQLFTDIYVPEKVFSEVTLNSKHPESSVLANYLTNHVQLNPDLENDFTQLLQHSLDDGEVQALALAKQLNSGVLMDEQRGRKLATYHAIPVVGVLGVLMKSKQMGLITEISPMLEQLQHENYHLSASLVARVLAQSGES